MLFKCMSRRCEKNVKKLKFSKKGVDKSMVLWYYIQGSAEGTSKEVETEGSGTG